MSKEFPLIVTSDGSISYQTQNKSNKFAIQLSEPIELSSSTKWEIGLKAIHYPNSIIVGDNENFSFSLWTGIHLETFSFTETNFFPKFEDIKNWINSRIPKKIDSFDSYKKSDHSLPSNKCFHNFFDPIFSTMHENIEQTESVEKTNIEKNDIQSAMREFVDPNYKLKISSQEKVYFRRLASPGERENLFQSGIWNDSKISYEFQNPNIDFGFNDRLCQLFQIENVFGKKRFFRRRLFWHYLHYRCRNCSLLHDEHYEYFLNLIKSNFFNHANNKTTDLEHTQTFVEKILLQQMKIDINDPESNIYSDFEFNEETNEIIGWWKEYFFDIDESNVLDIYDLKSDKKNIPISSELAEKIINKKRFIAIIHHMLYVLSTERKKIIQPKTKLLHSMVIPLSQILLYSDIIQPIKINETNMKLLAIIPHQPKENETCSFFEPRKIQFLPFLFDNTLSRLEFYLLSSNGEQLEFLNHPVILEIIIRQAGYHQ